MRRIVTGLMLSALLAGPAVWAQEEREDVPTTTVAEASEVTRGYLRDEKFGIKPLVGVLAYRDTAVDQSDTGRFAVGLALDMNVMPFMDDEMRNWYVGPSTGVIYSHLGESGSSFFGSAPDVAEPTFGGGAGANALIIPTNLKIGYNFGDKYRLSAHGGANIVYRSIANSMNLEDPGTVDNPNDSLWKYYPNAGADLEISLGRDVALNLRPDWTFTPNDNFLTASLALGIALT